MFVVAKAWLGGVALSGVLLAGSIPAAADFQPTVVSAQGTGAKVIQVSTGSYAEVIHRDLKWTPKNDPAEIEPPVAGPGPVAAAPAEPASGQKSTAQAKPVPVPARRPIQVAQATASRGGSKATGLVERALSLRGIPYVFGGTSRSGFDCSGFTQYVFATVGISLPRSSYAQFGVGSSVTRADLRPGDLVFFTTYAPGPSHVGIYIGGGDFVQASDSGVRITRMSDSYYAHKFVGARRVR
ncbi:NlpC/P60 family [Acididesulfobacillus acetoxydans]|uniref:Cell wall-associated hydrolase, invasion-associated protein n=1 Tax=Acididesulfobacillus acetoxydans TaxID=1561005 RepID=A0A8S0X4X6_9FIRM|nr:C40 family peptidase [Acididesulfobacillus acetoxydans]CAA7601160.1 NlpC/P60 family [Acididesulfobacillus acetoxydans]CEJ08561.1 Cell wall-associated hydrolase, invasion-associated protein [Acididesulfobacillus acetoxydans]